MTPIESSQASTIFAPKRMKEGFVSTSQLLQEIYRDRLSPFTRGSTMDVFVLTTRNREHASHVLVKAPSGNCQFKEHQHQKELSEYFGVDVFPSTHLGHIPGRSDRKFLFQNRIRNFNQQFGISYPEAVKDVVQDGTARPEDVPESVSIPKK